MSHEDDDYLISNGFVTFFALLMTLMSALAVLSIFDSNSSSNTVEYGILCFTAFIWTFRFKRVWFWWTPRLFSVFAFIGIYVYIYNAWQGSFFIDEGQKCGKANELSPLFIYLTAGTLALNYSLSGAQFSDQSFLLKRKLSVFNFLWYVLYLPGIVMCLWLFSNTFDAGLLVRASGSLVNMLLIFAVIVAGIVGVFFLFSLPDKRRAAIVKTDYEKVSQQTIDDVLDAYQEFVLSGPYCRLYGVNDDKSASKLDTLTLSKVGGVPYAEKNDSWPVSIDPECLTKFCIQLVLNDTKLPPVWLDRLIVVFVVDYGVEVRSYAAPNISNAIDISHGVELCEERLLYSRKVPIDKNLEVEEDGWSDFDEGYTSAYALENNQPLKQRVMLLSEYPEKFLDLLLDNAGYPMYDPIDIIRQAPTPNLIQGPHDPSCRICSQPLRFLFEFGEILESEYTFGDGGMVYIYGCDQHPDYCEGFVDSH